MDADQRIKLAEMLRGGRRGDASGPMSIPLPPVSTPSPQPAWDFRRLAGPQIEGVSRPPIPDPQPALDAAELRALHLDAFAELLEPDLGLRQA